MPKHIRRKKTTSPARAKPRAAARAVAGAAPAKPAPAKKRGRRRGLLSGLGTHEHERDILDQYLHEVSRSEEHTSELQSHSDLVCRLLLEKKKKKNIQNQSPTDDACKTTD